MLKNNTSIFINKLNNSKSDKENEKNKYITDNFEIGLQNFPM